MTWTKPSHKFLLREGGDMMLFWWEGGGEDCNSAHKKTVWLETLPEMLIKFPVPGSCSNWIFSFKAQNDRKSLVHIPNVSGSQLALPFLQL